MTPNAVLFDLCVDQHYEYRPHARPLGRGYQFSKIGAKLRVTRPTRPRKRFDVYDYSLIYRAIYHSPKGDML